MATSTVFAVILLAIAITAQSSIVAPAVHQVAYTRAVPYNVLPFANSVNVFTRNLAAPVPLFPSYAGLRTPVLRSPLYPGLSSPVVPGVAPFASPIAPIAKVSSFLPAPFVAPAGFASGVVPAAPVGVGPQVIQGVAPQVIPGLAPQVVAGVPAPAVPSPIIPAVRAINPYFPQVLPSSINPAYGRSIHAVAPAAVPTVPVASPHYVGK